MVDIKEGDLLVVNGIDYPIKSVADYTGFPITPTFRRMATQVASTKRTAPMVDGKTTNAVLYLSGLKIVPITPLEAEIRQTLDLDTPHELARAYVADEEGFLELTVEILKI